MKNFQKVCTLLLLAGCLFLLPSLGFSSSSPEVLNSKSSKADTPKKAPDFSLPDVKAGGTMSLSKFKGKVVLLNYWATWCGPCVGELPDLNALHKEFQPKGFEIIGISIDQNQDVVKNFMKGTPINYTVVMGNDEVKKSYGGIYGIPKTFLIDRQGRIRKEYTARIDKAQVTAQIKALLSEK